MRGFLILLVATFLVSGCTSFELTRVRNDLARHAPEARIGDGYAVSFGGVSLGLARWITGLNDDDPETRMIRAALSEVRRVQFGRYKVEGAFDATTIPMPSRLRSYLEEEGWQLLASIRDTSEAVWIVYQEEMERVVDLLAVVLDEDELVLAKISGDLNAVVAAAMTQQDLEIPWLSSLPESPATMAREPVHLTAKPLPKAGGRYR